MTRAATGADAEAKRVLAKAASQGVQVEVVRGVLLLSGRAPAAVREVWRGPLRRHRDAIARLLGGAPAASAGPEQTALPGFSTVRSPSTR